MFSFGVARHCLAMALRLAILRIADVTWATEGEVQTGLLELVDELQTVISS